MKEILFLAFFFAFPVQAETPSEHYHADAMAALKDCKETWFQSSRERALKIIDDAGTYLATTLDPSSSDYNNQVQMLDEVTSALERCGMLAYPDDSKK